MLWRGSWYFIFSFKKDNFLKEECDQSVGLKKGHFWGNAHLTETFMNKSELDKDGERKNIVSKVLEVEEYSI